MNNRVQHTHTHTHTQTHTHTGAHAESIITVTELQTAHKTAEDSWYKTNNSVQCLPIRVKFAPTLEPRMTANDAPFNTPGGTTVAKDGCSRIRVNAIVIG